MVLMAGSRNKARSAWGKKGRGGGRNMIYLQKMYIESTFGTYITLSLPRTFQYFR